MTNTLLICTVLLLKVTVLLLKVTVLLLKVDVGYDMNSNIYPTLVDLI